MYLVIKWTSELQSLKSNVAIVLAGEIDVNLTDYLNHDDFVIAVDGGLDHLLAVGLTPDILIGDLDSISTTNYNGQQVVYDSVKDDTDFVCAIKYAKANYPNTEIRVFGFASLNRLDHVLANLSVIQPGMTFISDNQTIQLLSEEFIAEQDEYQYYSFISMSTVNQFSLTGFKYPLTNYQLRPFDPLCVSNELIANSGKIEISNDCVIMIKSKNN